MVGGWILAEFEGLWERARSPEVNGSTKRLPQSQLGDINEGMCKVSLQ